MIYYTKEQTDIIESDDDFMYVIAFAGTGKTTTLKAYAKRRPDKKILYLAYNDSVVKEARNKFPQNVEVLTSHSLAFRNIGVKYKHKLQSFIKPEIIRKALLLGRSKDNLILSKKVLEGIEKYCYSSYTNIEDCYYLVSDLNCSKKIYINFVKRIWAKMEDVDSNFPIIHDFYLKKFELISPRLPYDSILFDEAQDSNPATKNIIMKQRMYSDITILFVGDNHQEIYSFRGSKNALVSNEKEYFLTQSFRFGKEIAKVGNKLINVFKNEEKEIQGNELINDAVGVFNPMYQTAYISRTNSMVIANAIKLAEENKRIFFIGGIKSYNFDKIMDVDNLYTGNYKDIKDFNIKRYKSFSTFEKISKQEENNEFIFLCKIVKTYSEKLRTSIKKINSLTVTDKNKADVIISTAHKSKGLEFNQVVLSNDFNKFFDKNDNIKLDIKQEEINILYVALTRAIYSLVPNRELEKIMGVNNV